MEKKIDFTNCKRIIGRAYNGANGKKIAVEYEYERYMIKFPPSGNKKPTELSYANSYISEDLKNPIAADNLANEFVKSAEALIDFPYSNTVYHPIRPLKREYGKLLG